MQVELCETPAFEVMIGGMAGPGKTWAMLFEDLYDCLTIPQLRVLYLRRESPRLADGIQKAIEMYTPFGAKLTLNSPIFKRTVIQFPEFDSELNPIGPNGAVVIFGHMEHEKDRDQYAGQEYHRIKFDEVTEFSKSQYLFMFSRLRPTIDRRTGQPIKTTMRSTCNPWGAGMLWVKNRFIDQLEDREIGSFKMDERTGMWERTSLLDPEGITRQWIRGDRTENVHLGKEYEMSLNNLSEKERRALKYGSWELDPEPDQLIDPKWLDHALLGKVAENPDDPNYSIAGDFAHMGDDKAVIFEGYSNRVVHVSEQTKIEHHEFAFEISNRVHMKGDAMNVKCAVDSNGPGSGVGSLLSQDSQVTDRSGKVWNIKRVPNLHLCVHKDPLFEMKYRGSIRFNSFRGQVYWKLREDLRMGKVDLSTFNKPPLDMYWQGLQEELLAHTYSIPLGILQVVQKDVLRKADRLGRSPDYADALAYWNFVREFPAMGEVDMTDRNSLEYKLKDDPHFRQLQALEDEDSEGSIFDI